MLRTLIDSLPDYVFVKDMESRYVTANRAHLELLGADSPDEIVGKQDFGFFPPEVAERHYNEEQEVIWSGQALTNRFEAFHAGDDGVRRWLVTTIVPFADSSGNVTGLVGVSRDITARKQAEDALGALTRELSQSNAELEQFAHVASHDLQEPLRVVSSYVKLLAERYGDQLDEDAADFIGFAVNGVERMQAMIDDLLVYSRVGTRGRPFEEVDCEKVLQSALSNLAVAVEESEATVAHDPMPTVKADASQLTQLFQNLIANALKFRGEPPPRVRVSAHQDEEGWHFAVRDNGIGIDPDYSEEIFEIFRRLHDREQFPGTGMGLAVCRKIVERHGGRIWVESEPAEGCEFHFIIPSESGADA